ncbi:hypothetical protein D0C36_13420 [Mucilaginibacter conchicola]|uniref:Transglycosylase SLT domain-containing protein n=1 Tax=Mucilaginibacter conchicola TaxID=2303333 RepID=A0A372NTI2_9SPHI|nr:hypothetical protein [Mucilaginibacter conchicola]RFZ92422.1 hypothetical protein D0C36_13420 [Mucilaginibacter conchicola]
MFAKKICKAFLAIVLLLNCCIANAKNYRKLFDRHYQKAETSAAAIRPLLQKYSRLCGEDAKQMEAVIFPELMRYNQLFDAVETGSLMGLYSRLGSDYADFSIGRFQMKPSFALSIEEFAKQHNSEAWVKALGFNDVATEDNYENRSARIDRLNDTEWQVKYLVAVFKSIRLKHTDALKPLSAEKKLAFIATAYNCGWDKDAETVKRFSNKCFYCIARWDSRARYNFADIAVHRYREIVRGKAFSNV